MHVEGQDGRKQEAAGTPLFLCWKLPLFQKKLMVLKARQWSGEEALQSI